MSQMIPACLPSRELSRPKVPPDQVVQQHRILVTNPAKLHGFQN
jgi:hypothetical protein